MRIGILVLITSIAGCGGGSADLTCDYLADPGNCWAEAAAATKACLPPATETAVLQADRASCLFADGTRIVFDTALPTDDFDLERFAFTIEKDGSDCARFVDTFENRLELEAGGHSAIGQLRVGVFSLQCGGGKTYKSDFDLLFDCTPGTQPTDGFSVSAGLVTFMIISVSTPGELFRCAP